MRRNLVGGGDPAITLDDVDRVLSATDTYLHVPSVVGHELPFLRYLEAEMGGLGSTECARGWLRVTPRQSRDDWIVSAHIDRHGLVAVSPGRFRYAAHVIGDGARHRPEFLTTVCRRVAEEEIVAYDPDRGTILGRGTAVHTCDLSPDLVFELPELAGVPPGTPAGFAAGCRVDGGRVSGQLDNALSVALAHHVVERAGVAAVFTCEEEVGRSWSHLGTALERMPASGALLVLDTSPFPTPEHADVGTVVLRRRDAGAEFDVAAVARLEAACVAAGVPYLFKDDYLAAAAQRDGVPARLGRTELGRLIAAGTGRSGATLQIPTFDYHSNHETTTTTAIDNVVAVLGALLGE